MDLHPIGKVLGSLLKMINHGADCHFKSPQLVQIPRTAPEQNSMQQLIPRGILLGGFSAEEFRVKRANGRNGSQSAAPHVECSISSQQRLSEAVHYGGGYLSAFSRPDEFPLRTVRDGFIQHHGKDRVGILPFPHHALIEMVLVLRKPCNPVFLYRASMAR